MRRRPFRLLTFASAALVAAVVTCQLLMGAADHDPLAHADEPADTCVVCVLGHVHETAVEPPPVPAGPAAERISVPTAPAAPSKAAPAFAQRARGPPIRA